MADGAQDEAARTSAGFRRPRVTPPTAPAAAGATGAGRRRDPTSAPPPPAADATGLGRRRGTARPSSDRHDPSPQPADATGLGIRRTGSAPSSDAVTSMVGLRPPTAGFPAATGAGRGRPPATATGHGARTPQPVVRFGPGGPAVPPPPAEAPAAPAWQRPPSAPPAPTRRRGRPVVGGLLTLAAVAAVIAYLLARPTGPVGVQGVRVAAQPAQAGCGTTVVLVGSVATDGPGGTFSYRWERSDGQVGEVLTQSVPAGATSTDVRLQWTVSGPGRLDGSATLRVLDGAPVTPEAGVGTGGFTYSCA